MTATDRILAAIKDAGAANVEALRFLTDTSAQAGQAIATELAEHRLLESQRHTETMAALDEIKALLTTEPDPPPDPPPPPPPPPSSAPRFGFIDATRGHDVMDQLLADAIGGTRPVGTFVRGFSGSSHPDSLGSSSCKAAPGLGLGAVLNTKLDWAGLLRGDFDTMIRTFYETWPVGTWGDVTVNHEPENDLRDTENMTWIAGVQRYIAVAAEVIRARGLDVKVGGCLMDFSWTTERWKTWQWWQGLAPVDLPNVTFGIDAYVKHHINPVRGADLMPRINTLIAVARGAGIGSFTLFETAVDKRAYTSEGGQVVGTDQTVADWWVNYAAKLTAIPEVRTVSAFHDPAGPASAFAQLNGVALTAYADICMNGRRP